jgi:hypothetical protein
MATSAAKAIAFTALRDAFVACALAGDDEARLNSAPY